MAKENEWEKDVFDILLDNPELSDEELSRRIGRKKGAIGWIRAYIHNYHRGGDITGLSNMMKCRLEQRSWTCPRCTWKKAEMEIKDNFPLHTVKKVTIVVYSLDLTPPSTESSVNQLLSKGWVLLAVHTTEVSPKNQTLVFTLGHTDASADDTVEAKYRSPKELGF